MPEIEVERHRAVATVHVSGDMANEPWLVQVLRAVLDDLADERVRRIDLDLSEVTVFDMACLAHVVGLAREVKRTERTFSILAPSPAVQHVLRTAQVTEAL